MILCFLLLSYCIPCCFCSCCALKICKIKICLFVSVMHAMIFRFVMHIWAFCDIEVCTYYISSAFHDGIPCIIAVEDDYRVIRDCAWLSDMELLNKCHDRAGMWHIKFRTCYCTEPGCNSAPGHKMSLRVISTLTAFILLLPLLFR